jgi:hypothetical protein
VWRPRWNEGQCVDQDGWVKHVPKFVDNGESSSKYTLNATNAFYELEGSMMLKEDEGKMKNVGVFGACIASSSYLLRVFCGRCNLEESV